MSFSAPTVPKPKIKADGVTTYVLSIDGYEPVNQQIRQTQDTQERTVAGAYPKAVRQGLTAAQQGRANAALNAVNNELMNYGEKYLLEQFMETQPALFENGKTMDGHRVFQNEIAQGTR